MKRLLMIAVALLPLVVAAQAKIGIVNSQQLFDLMPEKAAAETQLKALSDKYHAEYVLLQGEFDKKYADYQTIAADASVPETIKERRIQELQEGDKKLREFEQRAADDMAARREALTRPIADKVQEAIRTVGQQGAFDVVFDTAVTPVAYTGPATVDITPMVKAILGI
jgi:outer membrane protein